MFVEVYLIDGSSLRLPVTEGLTVEDICIHCCRVVGVCPVAQHLFALRKEDCELFCSPSEIVAQNTYHKYSFRVRFWPAVCNFSRIGTVALNYLYDQVRKDYVSGKIVEFEKQVLQSEALGLGVTAMYCHMKDNKMSMDSVLDLYKRFLPKAVRKNCHLTASTNSLRKSLKEVIMNPPEVLECKQMFLKKIAGTTYTRESYSVHVVEQTGEVSEHQLIIQPMDKHYPGLRLRSLKKKSAEPDVDVCELGEICFILSRGDGTMEISRVNGVPVYFRLQSEDVLQSCISGLSGYYRLKEKWTFDLCHELLTPSLIKLKSLKCHGPVGEEFAYKKLKHKRQNKPGCWVLRQSQSHYDEFHLDVCLNEGEQVTTFTIEKTPGDRYAFRGFPNRSYSSIRDLLTKHNEATEGILNLKECIPPSENDISDLLLCRIKTADAQSETSRENHNAPQLPVCFPRKAIQLHGGFGRTRHQFSGSHTFVNRGVWWRDEEPLEIVQKIMKPEFQISHSQEFIESLQRSLFWRCETIVKQYGIILDVNLSVVMEYLPLGPFDKYLQSHELHMIDLVEAGTNLAKALFYLEENGCVHGNIRCRNLLVASHTANSLRIKLSDPGVSSCTSQELPWVPVELYNSNDDSRNPTLDTWAFGTTLWEIFSRGQKPCAAFNQDQTSRAFLLGWRLPRPHKCLGEIYKIMLNTWSPDVHQRPKAQSIMRDINQILYEVYNSQRSHSYEVVKQHDTSSGSFFSSITDTTTVGIGCTDNDDTCKAYQGASHLMLPSVVDMSLLDDDDDMDELSSEIYEIEHDQLQLGQLIGQGFYGQVRMGIIKHKDGTEETVAVKKLKNSAINSPESMDLQREGLILRSLSHPNIVEIKAIVATSCPMLVMEYMPMGSLLAYLRIEKYEITNLQLLKFAADVAEGMEYLGQKNIVHRDLAARNILVACEDIVKISDFGLARHVSYNGYYVVKNNTQKLPMPWYAPESLAYWKFSSQSDVWSYGVTLYEMFSRGQEPHFVSGDQTVLLQALQQGRRLPCPSQCPQIIYAQLMRLCWNMKASNRPSFSDILSILQDLKAQL